MSAKMPTNVKMSIEEFLEARVQTAWLIGSNVCDHIIVAGNWIDDYDMRWPKFFKFHRQRGMIDECDRVYWAGMGGWHVDACGPKLRAAIKKQTGI